MKKNRGFKAVLKYDNGTIMTNKIVIKNLVIIYNFNWQKIKCLLESIK